MQATFYRCEPQYPLPTHNGLLFPIINIMLSRPAQGGEKKLNTGNFDPFLFSPALVNGLKLYQFTNIICTEIVMEICCIEE